MDEFVEILALERSGKEVCIEGFPSDAKNNTLFHSPGGGVSRLFGDERGLSKMVAPRQNPHVCIFIATSRYNPDFAAVDNMESIPRIALVENQPPRWKCFQLGGGNNSFDRIIIVHGKEWQGSKKIMEVSFQQ